MKKMLLVFIIILLMNLTVARSVEITDCKSGTDDWVCEQEKTCVCTISGTCTDGNLLLYRGTIANPSCSPPIIGLSTRIDWDRCGNPSGYVQVRADCEEGQSSEKTIIVSFVAETTTTIPIPTERTCPYECCMDEEGYRDKYCPDDLECCDNVCKESCEEIPKKGGKAKLIGIILLILILGVGLLIFLKRRRPKQQKKTPTRLRYY